MWLRTCGGRPGASHSRPPLRVEAAIEFGGNLEVDAVVAKGGVYAMAGIYFQLKGSMAKLNGYLRCRGYLNILGLVSISVEFRMELEYGDTISGSEVGIGQPQTSGSVLCVAGECGSWFVDGVGDGAQVAGDVGWGGVDFLEEEGEGAGETWSAGLV